MKSAKTKTSSPSSSGSVIFLSAAIAEGAKTYWKVPARLLISGVVRTGEVSVLLVRV